MSFIQERRISEFKREFYERVKDLHLFDCGDINILKIVLDGLRPDRVMMSTKIGFFYNPEWYYRFILLLMRVKRYLFHSDMFEDHHIKIDHLKKQAKKKVLLIDDGRAAIDSKGRMVSYYGNNLLNYLGRDKVIYILGGIKPNELSDFHYIEHLHYLLPADLSMKERYFRKELIRTFKRIRSSGLFSKEEMERIKGAIVLFFFSFRAWNSILSYIHPQVVYINRTYYVEGLLLALKRYKIRSVELQHGLFSKYDIDYIFPHSVLQVRDAAFFPDQIFMYGQFWKDRLLTGFEFAEDQIGVIGYYPQTNIENEVNFPEGLKEFIEGKGVILVATQFYLEKDYCDYITWLSNDIQKRKQNYVIVVKLHPGDNQELYTPIESLENVRMVRGNINDYLPIADMLVSIFSTTIYDAIRYGVPSFALETDIYGDHVEEIINSGIAVKLKANQSPIDHLDEIPTIKEPGYYLQEPNYEILKNGKALIKYS